MGSGIRSIVLALLAVGLLTPPALAQSLNVEGYPVYPAAVGGTYSSALTASSAQLSDGSRTEFWRFAGRRGACIHLEMSTDSDSLRPLVVLRRGRPSGRELGEPVLQDQVASLDMSPLPADDYYFVQATSAGSSQQLGAYRLIIRSC